MILYGVNYNGPLSNYNNSLVTIHKTIEEAKQALQTYLKRWDPDDEIEYGIVKIDTDSEPIYDYEYSEVLYNQNP